MNVIKRNLYLLIASVCLLPGISTAQDEDFALDEGGDFTLEDTVEKKAAPVYYSEWEAGTIYISEDSYKFGEYTGLEQEAFYFNGSFLIRSISAYDDDSTKYYEVTGSNLGLDSRSLFGEYGEQGKYSVYFDFDQLPHFAHDDTYSLFVGAGTANQTLPAGWVRGANTGAGSFANPALFPSSNQVDVETQRTKLGGGYSWIPAESWQVTSNYHHEMKDGTEVLGGAFGTNSGSPATQLIIPVDFEFDEFDVGINYADKVKQFDLRYNLSLFRNDEESVTWSNPFSGGGVTGRTSLPPDNSAHQVSLTGGYNLGLTSRLSGTLSYSQMLQDDTFLPFSIDNALCAPTTGNCLTALPQRDLDGEVEKWYGNLNYSIRPLKDLDVGVRYTYNKWDNNTPQDQYIRVRTDTVVQNPSVASSVNRINRPYSFEQHKAEMDAGYRLTRKTKLSLGYEFDWNQRDMTEVAITRENTGKVKLAANPFDMVSGWIEYARSDRKGSPYDPNRPFTSNVSAAFIAANLAACTSIIPGGACRDNDFFNRKIYLADREQDRVTGSLTLMPADLITFGLTGIYTTQDFDDTGVGTTLLETYSATFDVGYTPRENIDTYAYYTYEFFDREQAGREVIQGLPLDNQWLFDTEDRINTVGAGIKWSKIRDKFDVTANYTFSKAITLIDPIDNIPPDTALDFPDVVTGIHSFSLQADYNLKDNVIWRLNYLYENFSSKNWALDAIGQTIPTVTNVINLGNQSPDYNVHAIGMSVIYKF